LAKQLGQQCISVLGNHDLHLLAVAYGRQDYQHHQDTLTQVIDAPDADELLTWLKHQPLFHYDETLQFSMVHAGVPPQWSIHDCLVHAKEVESVLQGNNWPDFFNNMYGNEPKQWSEDLTGWDRLRYITNCFTRLRFLSQDGRLALKFKGAPQDNPNPQIPWFEMPERKTQQDRIIFGHWSQLGVGEFHNTYSLDSGAVWGEALTAIRIDKAQIEWFSIEADPTGLPHARNKNKNKANKVQ
jgi:bis(5'-nucleosyl)-tetraphosphatase (symmetrical)